MSFFNNVKKSLGLSKSKAPNSPHQVYELTFLQQKLGMGLSMYTGHLLPTNVDGALIKSGSDPDHSWPIITTVAKTSEAFEYGVSKGDIIIALEGVEVSSFADFSSFIVAMARPVTIRFLRLAPDAAADAVGASNNNNNNNSSTTIPAAGSNINTALSNSLQSINTGFTNMIRGGSTTTTAAATRVLTEEEKEQRRIQNANAALSRSSQWDKSLSEKRALRGQKAKQKNESQLESKAPVTAVDPTTGRLIEVGREAAASSDNPETQRLIEQTKAMEKKVAQDLGYSPFQPHMSAAGNAPAGPVAAAAAAATTTATTTILLPPLPPTNEPVAALAKAEEVAAAEDDVDQWVADVDDAFAMLLSLGESEQEKAKIAVQTVHKMLQNLHSNKNEVKFRSIRTANKAFQSKVSCVPGGPELLLAAGYTYQESTANTATDSSSATNSSATTIAAGTGSISAATDATGTSSTIATPIATRAATEPSASIETSSGEMFLRHPMDVSSQRRLHYTIRRLQELLESNEVS